MVSHGGLLFSLIDYFAQELGCSVLGGNTTFLNRIHNTAVSKFTVSLPRGEEDPPAVTCLILNDQDHLTGPATYTGAGPMPQTAPSLPHMTW